MRRSLAMGTAGVVAALGATVGAAQAALAPLPVGNATLRVEITNIQNDRGVVRIDLCREVEFLKDCPIHGEARAVRGTTVITVNHLPPGVYAVQAFHDENGNGRVDRMLFGIPKEGVGFSNDAPIRFGPPKWRDAMFALNDDKTVTLKMRYFGGGSRQG